MSASISQPDPGALTPVEELISRLQLEPLEQEGGYFRRTHLSAHSSAIYYLLAAPDVSALHTLTETEVYHWYAGAPLELLVLDTRSGSAEVRVLGPDFAAGQEPQIVVPAGSTHGSRPLGAWSLVGTTMSPPFNWEGFALGDREALSTQFPEYRDRIHALTRDTTEPNPSAAPRSPEP